MDIKLDDLYKVRFGDQLAAKNAIWTVLCRHFFQKYIPDQANSTVVDIGCGYGEFINNIVASHKIAVDINSNNAQFLDQDVQFVCANPSTDKFCENETVDTIFMSNFLEHLPDKNHVLSLLFACRMALKTGGQLVIMGPNIRFAYREYWDFFDHIIPISHDSISEALRMTGFEIVQMAPRFLPYTTKSSLPQWPWLVKLYLLLPLAWRVFGKQFLIVSKKS